MRCAVLLAVIVLATESASAEPPTLLADLNTTPAAVSSAPVRVNWAAGSAVPTDFALLRSSSQRMWLTDGVTGGAREVGGLIPTISPSSYNTIAARTAGGRVAFVRTPVTASFLPGVLFGLDTATATAIPLLEGPSISNRILPAGEKLVFACNDGVHGLELWQTDGTPAGTALLADLVPGSADSGPTLVSSNGAVAWFTVKRSAATPRELWVTDGTAGGTRALGPLSPLSETSVFITSASLGAGVACVVREADSTTSLYVADASSAPTARLTANGVAISPGTGPILSAGSHILFVASQGGVQRLFVSDGTPAGTVSISEDRLVFSSEYAVTIDPSAPLGWRVFYPGGPTASSTEPCVTDGTRAGTRIIADLIPGSVGSSPRNYTVLGTRAAYSTSSFVSESFSLTGTTYLSDGTPEGTVDLAALPGAPQAITPIGLLNGRLLLSGRDDRGSELWSFADDAFAFVEDLDPRTASPSNPLTFTGDDRTTIVAGFNGTLAQALFRTDGTSHGTFPVTTPVGPITASSLSCPQQIGVFGDRVTIFAGTSTTGEEPWTIDRDTGAASLVRDIIPGAAGSTDINAGNNCIGWFNAAQIDQRGVFVARVVGVFNAAYAVWATDGAPGGAGTVQLATFQRGPAFVSGPLFNFTVAGNRAFFIGPRLSTETPSSNAGDLWSTDGASVRRAIDFAAAGLSVPLSMSGWNGHLYFVSTQSGRGRIFRTDGVNPHALVPIGAEADALSVQWLLPTARGLLFQSFVPGTNPAVSALWFTDATTGTAVRLTPDSVNFQPLSFVEADPLVFFSSRTVDHGRELWVTDLTPEGTRVAADINPGPFSSDPTVLHAIGPGRVALSAFAPGLGIELWQSDGTPLGTRIIGDIAPGERSSSPGGARLLGDRLIFAADDQSPAGRELWAWTITPLCRCDLNDSGGPDPADLFNFLDRFFEAAADFNGDGATTLQDVFDFLACWFAGCE